MAGIHRRPMAGDDYDLLQHSSEVTDGSLLRVSPSHALHVDDVRALVLG